MWNTWFVYVYILIHLDCIYIAPSITSNPSSSPTSSDTDESSSSTFETDEYEINFYKSQYDLTIIPKNSISFIYTDKVIIIGGSLYTPWSNYSYKNYHILVGWDEFTLQPTITPIVAPLPTITTTFAVPLHPTPLPSLTPTSNDYKDTCPEFDSDGIETGCFATINTCDTCDDTCL